MASGGSASRSKKNIIALLENEDELVKLARTANRAGVFASQILEIDDALTAFEFDAACDFVLKNHEQKHEAEKLNVLLKSLSIMLGGNPKDEPENATDGTDAEDDNEI